jgi:CRISPR-associated protein Cmr2
MDIWKRKLLALLHDPPDKAYDFGPLHEEKAQHYAARLGLSPNKLPPELRAGDHVASAADRVILPSGQRIKQALGGGASFTHPMTGDPAFATGDFPAAEDAERFFTESLPDFSTGDPKLTHWLVWRLWLQYAATHPDGQAAHAETLAYLPADTRVPDGTIWHHNAVTSAIEGTRNPETGELEPAFLLLNLGPVQQFIAQARSTRDLWSGSYLLSWMMAHLLAKLADQFGPDAVIFPNLRGQPLYDWIERDKLKQAKFERDGTATQTFWDAHGLEQDPGLALTPNLPNRLLAVVPRDFDAQAWIDSVLDPADSESEWGRITHACWDYIAQACPLPDFEGTGCTTRETWDDQLAKLWQVQWQVQPWTDVTGAIEKLREMHDGAAGGIEAAYAAAMGIPDEHKDTRCYSQAGELNPGWAWSAHYQATAHRLAARRNTQDFRAWQGHDNLHKDALSGKEEALGTPEWLERARKNPRLRHLFRKNDVLGAINLLKRVWHKAYLEEKCKLVRKQAKFDSVASVAAAGYVHDLYAAIADEGPLREDFLTFARAASSARDLFPDHVAEFSGLAVERWLEQTDHSVFHADTWAKAGQEPGADPARAARAALTDLSKTYGGGAPKYYAVIALDGDQVGRWLGGEKAPPIGDVLSAKATAYFRESVPDATDWLEGPRPLSPSYHLQFSEALSNFGLYCARRIVEDGHHGQLIFAGGDDVLAMVPADEAIACANGLRMAYQGHVDLAGTYPGLFVPTVEGFVRMNPGTAAKTVPSWPLLVPGGKATVSAGIAIGYLKEPLQDMVREAQQAEKRAKNELGRNALSVTLFKRGGETIQWGTRFGSPALDLLDFLKDHYRKDPRKPAKERLVPGGFPCRVAELLMPYGADTPVGPEIARIVAAEFSWAVSQLTQSNPEQLAEFQRLAGCCLDALQAFRVAEEEPAPRPLRDFYNLFVVEAFISRQGK